MFKVTLLKRLSTASMLLFLVVACRTDEPEIIHVLPPSLSSAALASTQLAPVQPMVVSALNKSREARRLADDDDKKKIDDTDKKKDFWADIPFNRGNLEEVREYVRRYYIDPDFNKKRALA